MSKIRKRGLNRVAAVLVAAAAVAAGAAGVSVWHSLPQAHHAVADDGVISSRD